MDQMESRSEGLSFDSEALRDRFPSSELIVGYGSGIKRQQGYREDERPLLDFIIAVDDPEGWHRENMEKNPDDYSRYVRWFGPRIAAKIQEMGAGIFYNPYASLTDSKGEKEIKYGVISTKRLIQDLFEWDKLYTAGRLHKGVEVVDASPRVRAAIRENRKFALEVALVLLGDEFTEEELYQTITGISYTGDVRMGIGENPDKVKNIVATNMAEFREMYMEMVEQHAYVEGNLQQGFRQEFDPERIEYLSTEGLPSGIRNDFEGDILDADTLRGYVRLSIRRIVKQSSTVQTLKGFLTAGLRKSGRYIASKVSKGVRGKLDHAFGAKELSPVSS